MDGRTDRHDMTIKLLEELLITPTQTGHTDSKRHSALMRREGHCFVFEGYDSVEEMNSFYC